ncbi:MAG: Spy/CpxP family protein refolding chaperone [Rhodospirillales bacterium]|nr:MAG: Spy/CpxP family protein refolding chaperone [Rhodospirillales bacterium]
MNTRKHRRTRHFNFMMAALGIVGLIAILWATGPLAGASQRGHHGWPGSHGDRQSAMWICDAREADMLADVGAHIGAWLDLDAAQEAAWRQVELELERGYSRLAATCADLEAGADASSWPGRLASLESLLVAGADVLRDVRPVFTAFYEILDEAQIRTLEAHSRRHAFTSRP